MSQKNKIGPRVRQARKSAGLSQEELASKLQVIGVPIERSMVAKIESKTRPVSDIEIAAIADVLKVSVTWLFEENKG